ncbi:MAG: lactate racemase domain-containing protein [Candidatus Zixiibacteriota bacterium]
MQIPVWYSDSYVDITLPDSAGVAVFDLPITRLKPIPENHWMTNLQDSDSLNEFIENRSRLLIVVNDCFRPTPTAQILRPIEKFIPFESTKVLVATGLHPAKTSVNLENQFGALAGRIEPILHLHDAGDESNLSDFGKGESHVRLNKLFDWCDSILIIGSVEPHYFAGFTGGRKIILPGCSSFADVEQNHAFAIDEHSQPLKRTGNPVYDDIQRRTAVLNEIPRYAIQAVCDHKQNVYFLSHGDWDDSFNQACEFVIANYSHEISQRFDIVISIVYPPLDRNLYQLQKSYENVAGSVRDGGTVLLVSGCKDGVGDGRFLKIAKTFATSGSLPIDKNSKLIMGIHKVARTIALAKRVDLVLCSTLETSLLRHLPIAARSNLQTTVYELISKYGDKCKIAVVLDAASQVLYHRAA